MTDREKITQEASRSSLYILTFLWSFVSGILVSSFIFVSPLVSLSIIVLSLLICLAEKIYKKTVSKEIIFVVLALLSFGLGSLRYAIKDFHELKVPTDTGIVADEPEHRDTDTRFIFEARNGERVLVSTDMYSHVEYGDAVMVKGKLERPGVILEDDGRSFDYGAYLSKDDIYYTMSFAKVGILSSGNGNKILSALLYIKNTFIGKMKQILPEPESSLLAGLIVAGKQALPSAVLDQFKRAGVVHIVVLSGYNITIVAEFFLALLAFLPLRKRSIIAACGILLFVIMTGATATVVRAGIMALVVLLGKVVHRTYSAPRTLLLAAVLMLMFNPKLLVFDPSFELTFLAMLALIYVEPVVNMFLTKKLLPALGQASGQSRPIASSFVTLIATTIATQITVLPFLLYSVGNVSVVSLVSNILILVFVPFTMLVGFITVLLSFISVYVAIPFTFVTHLLLVWILSVARVLGGLTFASVQIQISFWMAICLYAVLIALIFGKEKARVWYSRSFVTFRQRLGYRLGD